MTRECENPFTFEQFIDRLKMMGIHDEVKELIAKSYGATLEEVYNYDKSQHAGLARAHIAWLIKERFQWSYPSLGELMGGRDHASMIVAVRRHEKKNNLNRTEKRKNGKKYGKK